MDFVVPIRRSPYTNPMSVFVFAWTLTLLLYMLQFSNLLRYSKGDAIQVVLAIVLPFVFGGIVANALNINKAQAGDAVVVIPGRNFDSADKTLRIAFLLWFVITLIEIAYSGGVPMIWSLTESYKTYFDFGIPTLHGLMNALLLSIVTIATFMAFVSGRKKYFLGVVFLMIWGVIVISRNLIIVGLLQCLFILFFIKGPPKGTRVIWLTLFGLFFIIAFGWIGDLRSGADAFFALAQPSQSYPVFLPSGFLWVYIYITTPLNNLIHQVVTTTPDWNWELTNTMSLLLPSVIRNALYDASQFTGDLVTEAFNVSTAFLNIYQDLSIPGMCVMSFAVGIISQTVYSGNRLQSVLYSSVLLQSAALSIFYNHYFYLPILFQYPLIHLLSRGMSAKPEPQAGMRQLSVQ
jgi:oligosaccharide repeat unit polymerase